MIRQKCGHDYVVSITTMFDGHMKYQCLSCGHRWIGEVVLEHNQRQKDFRAQVRRALNVDNTRRETTRITD